MHRHKSLLPLIHASRLRRTASTAAKLKPSDWKITSEITSSPYSPSPSFHDIQPVRDGFPTSSPPSYLPTAKTWPPPLTSVHNTSSQFQKQKLPSNSLNKWKRVLPVELKPLSFKDEKTRQFQHPARQTVTDPSRHHTNNTSRKPQRNIYQAPNNHSRSSAIKTLSKESMRSRNEKTTGDRISKERGSIRTHEPARSHKTSKRSTHRILKDVYIPTTVSVGTLARLLDVKLATLQRKMRQSGMENEANHDHVLTSEYAALLAGEFRRNPIVNDEAAFDIYPPPPHPDPMCCPSRPPVVTIMGHVDHGKTTLLDTLRSSSVAKGEAGGITQHIGAFSVPVPQTENATGPQSITFLDTPGHAAFSAMRARGAGVTDIVVLVVAADDGIMPQTKEVIELVKKDEGKVGLVVAINKIDKPGVDVETVKRGLLVEGIQLEDFGGDIPCVHVSGMTGEGLQELIETLSTMAELQELRAERDGVVYGHVLESKMQKGLGPVSTVLVLRGCLRTGTHIISGPNQAKIKSMSDSAGKSVKEAYPGIAVTVSGWKSLPKAGDDVISGAESDIKKAVVNRMRKTELEASLEDVSVINENRRKERLLRISETNIDSKPTKEEPSGPLELNLVVKADVSGSVEAIEGALQGIGSKKACTKVVSAGVGNISEFDVMMAKAAGATIVGFSVSAPRAIEILAAQNGIPITSSNIIYRLLEEVENRVIALLPVTIETKVTGEATVVQLFEIQLKSKQSRKVAGCRVVNGVVEKDKHARVIRSGKNIYEGSLETLRQLKKDVTEVRKGIECGLSFADFADLREGDIIQMYKTIEKPGSL